MPPLIVQPLGRIYARPVSSLRNVASAKVVPSRKTTRHYSQQHLRTKQALKTHLQSHIVSAPSLSTTKHVCRSYCDKSTGRSGDPKTETDRMSDQDYASFLDKASNEHQQASTSSKKEEHFTTRTVDDEKHLPKSLKDATSSKDAVYVSDADEQFVPVSLPFDGEGDVNTETFAHTTGLKENDVEELTAKQFDPQGQYKKLLDAVAKEGSSSTKVFRVQLKGARAEYWVVSTKSKRLVGVKAGAVES